MDSSNGGGQPRHEVTRVLLGPFLCPEHSANNVESREEEALQKCNRGGDSPGSQRCSAVCTLMALG